MKLSLPTLITIAANAITLLTSLVLLVKYRRLAQKHAQATADFGKELSALSADLDTVSQSAGDASRKAALLEAKMNQQTVEVVQPADVAASAKLNITERRHRVLSLWRRGLNTQTISSRLGLPVGEVELMIDLEKAA
jgi:DNA-binding NarL/FixJ family response regulator